MKTINVFLAALSLVLLIACNNKPADKTGNKIEKTEEDSLLDDVMDGHDAGMAKMGALIRAKEKATRLLDSINKLPAKTQQAMTPYKAKLNNVIADLDEANAQMNKWMEEFEMDSAVNNAKERINYLISEKGKVTKMKNAVLGSLQKADSVLKARF
jgi:DNA repair ATPase RecN